MVRPRMLVVAGPPGSGKTTYFSVNAFGVDAFNIDDRCAQIQGSYRAISREVRKAVAQECEQFVRQHIEQRRSSGQGSPSRLSREYRPRAQAVHVMRKTYLFAAVRGTADCFPWFVSL